MKRLQRWILGRFLVALIGFEAGLLALFSAVELFELRDHYGADPGSLAALGEYLALRAPFLAYLSVPVAILLAVILVMAGRAHASETVAAQAGGISLLRLSLPAWITSIALAILLLLGAEYRVPAWSDRADYIRRVVIQKKHAPSTEYRDMAFMNEGRFVLAERFDPANGILETVAMVAPSQDGSTAEVETAGELRFSGNGWTVNRAAGKSPDSTALATLPSPRWIELLAPRGGVRVLADKPIEALTLSTLWRENRDIDQLARRHGGDRRLRSEAAERLVKIQAKLSLPVSLPLLTLIGICLGARVGRRQGMGAAVGGALLASLGFMLLLQTATNLGTFAARSAALQPAAAVFPWLTPAILAVLATWFVRRSRFAN